MPSVFTVVVCLSAVSVETWTDHDGPPELSNSARSIYEQVQQYDDLCGTKQRTGCNSDVARAMLNSITSKLRELMEVGDYAGKADSLVVCHALRLVSLAESGLDNQTAALASGERSLVACPNDADVYYTFCKILRENGQGKRALEVCRQGSDIDPTNVMLLYAWAQGGAAREHSHTLITRLRAALAGQLPLEERVFAHFALSKCLHDIGDDHGKWAELHRANALAYREHAESNEQHRETLQQWILGMEWSMNSEVFRLLSARMQAQPKRSKRQRLPEQSSMILFIVGAPRSGSTLLEMILSAHPSVRPMGEAPVSLDLSNELMSWCMNMSITLYGKLSEMVASREATVMNEATIERLVSAFSARHLKELSAFARTYTQQVRQYYDNSTGTDPDAARLVFVDKTLSNYQVVPFLALLFPTARFIYLMRDPRDVAVSMYSMKFNDGHAYSYDLKALAHFLRDAYRLMLLWQNVVPLDRTMSLQYEQLVEDRERQTKAIIRLVGLEWDERCMFPERISQTKMVNTASSDQVRESVHSRSVGKWRASKKYLTVLLDALGDLSEFGYRGD
jgi:hypothetical protein